MTATATLAHTTSTGDDARLAIARVAAAGRVAAERRAAQRRAEAAVAHNLTPATAWVEGVVAAGATLVGFKVCLAEGGKWRPVLSPEFAAEFIARHVADGDEVEAWGLTDDGEYVGEVLSVW